MERELSRIAERQFGVISREQALGVGASRSAIDWRLRQGVWRRVIQGVYRVSGTPLTWMQQACAVLLCTGPESALSHRTAAYLFRLDGLCERAPTPIEVTVPRNRWAHRAGFVLHRSLTRVLAVRQSGLRVTPISRTLVDLSSSLDEAALEVALDSAQRRFPRVGEWLERHLETAGPRCGKGVRRLRHLLAVRMGERATDSALEVRVRRLLRRCALPRARTGVEVSDEQGFVMRLDFAWPAHNVALHVDGYRWHDQRARFERDARQRTRLAALGWLSLSVTHRALGDPSWLRALDKALRERAPQRPLPLGRTAQPPQPKQDRADPRWEPLRHVGKGATPDSIAPSPL